MLHLDEKIAPSGIDKYYILDPTKWVYTDFDKEDRVIEDKEDGIYVFKSGKVILILNDIVYSLKQL